MDRGFVQFWVVLLFSGIFYVKVWFNYISKR